LGCGGQDGIRKAASGPGSHGGRLQPDRSSNKLLTPAEPAPQNRFLVTDLHLALAASSHRLGLFAGRVRVFGEVTSTNDIVAEWADAGAEEGLVAVAESQSRGRGRLGRTWSSPPGAGIYISTLLRPMDAALPFLTLAAGVAVAEGIEAASGLRTMLKWPNDVCVPRPDGRWLKLAGILAEGRSDPGGKRQVVLGIGINVLQAAHPPDVSARATSMAAEVARPVDRTAVIVECLAALASVHRDLLAGGQTSILEAWTARASATFGRAVAWDSGSGDVQGIVDGIDAGGALLIRTGSGHRRVTAGEVRWLE
jgi:BirA family biotin operon repressor/biotin-[acetyl-CoA-carboxylase] ligase